MALSLPGKTPEIGTTLPIAVSPIARTLSDLEAFCAHARIYGHADNDVITVTDSVGNTYMINGFHVSIGTLKIGQAF